MGAFQFKQFGICDDGCGMKLSTDSVLLGSWVDVQGCATVVDLGCGSGILCLMTAQRNPRARILGIEIDKSACHDARENVQRSPWSERIAIECTDAMNVNPKKIFEGCDGIDLMISNPPYFSSELKSPDELRAQARHSASLSPFAVLSYAAKHLSPKGSVALVYPAELHGDVIFHAEMAGLKLRRECMVSAAVGKPALRALAQFARQDGPISKKSLCIRHKDNSYTSEYKEMTKQFYLKF